MSVVNEIERNRLQLGVPLTIIVAMSLWGTPGQLSYGQSDPHPQTSSFSVNATSPIEFEVVSVKMHSPDIQGSRMQLTPDVVRLSNVSLQDLIVQSYGLVVSDQIVGLPKWANSESFDIEAKVAGDDSLTFRKLTLDQIRSMGRPILADRFKFAGHVENRVRPLYTLVVAKSGSKLKRSTLGGEDGEEGGIARTGLIEMRHASNTTEVSINELIGRGVTVGRLAAILSQQGLGRVVLDNTDLADPYDFKLSWAADSIAAEANSAGSSGPSIVTAVLEQLGLKLEPGKGPVPVLVLDHIEVPSRN